MSASPPRRRGRPSRSSERALAAPASARRDDTATATAPGASDLSARTAILDAAERLFAAQGFAATTIKRIGADARVNPALLYYYFADKETLYREVIERLMGGIVAGGMQEMLAQLPPEQAIDRLVHFQVRYFLAHPSAPRIMARELADHDGARAEAAITRLAATLFSRVCEVIREGQRQGRFRPELDPRFAAISTIAQVVYLFIARPAVGILLGHDAREVPDAEITAFGDHAARFAVAALSVAPDDSP